MDSNEHNSDSLNETQSFLVIKEMIQVSKNKLKRDGILFIVWGWVLFFVSATGYIEVNKSFKGNYPLTTCTITEKGANAYEVYVNSIDEYFKQFKNEKKNGLN